LSTSYAQASAPAFQNALLFRHSDERFASRPNFPLQESDIAIFEFKAARRRGERRCSRRVATVALAWEKT
jgi:hypothetical protein